jgi:hypothetical protein
MNALAGLRTAAMASTLLAVGCIQPGGAASEPTSPVSVNSAHCSQASGSAWATHSDAVAGFSVGYPPGFTFELQTPLLPVPGVVESYRVVETCYLSVAPPGELEVDLYLKDADSLAGWVDKHTGGPAFISGTDQYFSGVTHQAPVRVAGHDALAFDWQPDAAPYTVHNTAIFLGNANVLVLGWWAVNAPGLPDASTNAAYAAALGADYKKMLAGLRLG